MTRTRRIAFLALLAMAWSALLPFTAAARMLLSDGPVEHCHRLSVGSAIYDADPTAPEGPSQPRKGPCPFCASAVFAPPASAPPLPDFVRLDAGIRVVAHLAPDPISRERTLPPSRAPPPPPRHA